MKYVYVSPSKGSAGKPTIRYRGCTYTGHFGLSGKSLSSMIGGKSMKSSQIRGTSLRFALMNTNNIILVKRELQIKDWRQFHQAFENISLKVLSAFFTISLAWQRHLFPFFTLIRKNARFSCCLLPYTAFHFE